MAWFKKKKKPDGNPNIAVHPFGTTRCPKCEYDNTYRTPKWHNERDLLGFACSRCDHPVWTKCAPAADPVRESLARMEAVVAELKAATQQPKKGKPKRGA